MKVNILILAEALIKADSAQQAAEFANLSRYEWDLSCGNYSVNVRKNSDMDFIVTDLSDGFERMVGQDESLENVVSTIPSCLYAPTENQTKYKVGLYFDVEMDVNDCFGDFDEKHIINKSLNTKITGTLKSLDGFEICWFYTSNTKLHYVVKEENYVPQCEAFILDDIPFGSWRDAHPVLEDYFLVDDCSVIHMGKFESHEQARKCDVLSQLYKENFMIVNLAQASDLSRRLTRKLANF